MGSEPISIRLAAEAHDTDIMVQWNIVCREVLLGTFCPQIPSVNDSAKTKTSSASEAGEIREALRALKNSTGSHQIAHH